MWWQCEWQGTPNTCEGYFQKWHLRAAWRDERVLKICNKPSSQKVSIFPKFSIACLFRNRIGWSHHPSVYFVGKLNRGIQLWCHFYYQIFHPLCKIWSLKSLLGRDRKIFYWAIFLCLCDSWGIRCYSFYMQKMHLLWQNSSSGVLKCPELITAFDLFQPSD